MTLLLTYHKVCDKSAAASGKEFYTVSPGQLIQHIETLKSRGLQNLTAQELIANPNSKGAAGRFVLCFDDGTAGHHEFVFPILQKYGCQGIFFVPTEKVDRPGYLTRAQIRELAQAGHVIAAHSHTHKRLDLSSRAEIQSQMARSKEIIHDITGITPVIFAPPGGFINSLVTETALAEGMKAIRTMRWGRNRKVDLHALETIPINRHSRDEKFIRALESNESSLLYAGKETLKRLIPLKGYELMRSFVFKFRKSG